MERYPTGYTPSALPFYSKLREKEFEQFCADLLNRQPVITVLKDGKAATRKIIEATLLLGGKEPQKGADIWAKDDCGEVWIFQCKRVQSFEPTKVSEVIEDAEKGFPQADHYVLVITCGLSEPAQQLIRDRAKWLLPWSPDRLTTVVFKLRPSEDASSLVRTHFGPEMTKRLFPGSDLPLLSWQDFFRRDLAETDKHFRHTISFIPWSDVLQRLMDFAQNGSGRALVLNAAGGQGKSRLLLELARNIEKSGLGLRVRFLNVNQHGLSNEQSDYLAEQTGDLLLIIDDAHRLGGAIEDVARATETSKSIRLLVSTRPQAVEKISGQLYQNGFSERLDERLNLPRWERDDICKLADKVLKPEHRAQTNILVDLADRCPLLVVLGADLINSGEHLAALADQRAFRERVFKSFKEDFLRHYPERRERLNRVISFLSFISPTKKDDTLLNNAAEVMGYSQLDVADDLDALDSAGLLAENWEGIRLYPDLFSDAVLLDACLDSHNRPSAMHKTVLAKLKLRDFPALIRNVAQADWESRSRHGVSDSLFDPIWEMYVKDFRDGSWPHGEDDFVKHWFGENPSLRAVMLEWWEPVAVFLPERTLELAGLAIKCMASPNDREWTCRNVPPLLKSIVERHPKYAEQALDLLWTLASLGAEGNNEYPFAAITAIAEAASFASQKEIKVNELVLSWLERKLKDPAAIEFLRSPKWILSALLKPFFVTEIGAAANLGTYRDRSEKTRPIRQRVLAIIESFLKGSDTRLGCALLPVLAEAINPGQWIPKEHLEAWRQECLSAFKVIEAAVKTHPKSLTLLTQLRVLLRNRRLNQDPTTGTECNRILETIPDTLELRVARALTSFAHTEFPLARKGPVVADPMESEMKWLNFNQEIAVDISAKFGTAHEVCEFLRSMSKEFQEAGQSVNVGGLLQQLAQVRVEWCAPILKEMVEANDPALDHGIWDALLRADKDAAQQYREAVEYLPLHGRSTQVSRLINFLGFKHANISSLAPFEREAVAQASKRTEEAVISELAWLCGFPLMNEPKMAMDVLSQLQRVGEKSGDAIMLALGRITEAHASEVEALKVAKCLHNVGEYCFPESSPNEFGLTIVAEKFPKEVYEHVRRLFELAESDAKKQRRPRTTEIPSLGQLGDVEYMDREIHALWDRTLKTENGGFSREFRLALIRSLIWSNAATALDRTRSFVKACKNADEIKLLAELVGPRPSRFVFDHPDVVRSILARAQELAVSDAVTKTLIFAACGGGRTYTDTELDPEYKYILEQGDALANRFRDDPLLQPFYCEIANWERHDLEWHRQQRRRED